MSFPDAVTRMRHVPETIPVSPWMRTRVFLVGERLVFVPAGLQGVEELGLRLHRRIRVHEGEIVGHHRVERGDLAGERSCPTSIVGGEDDCSVSSAAHVGAAERTDQAMTSRVVTSGPAQSQPTLTFLICPVLLDSIGCPARDRYRILQVAEIIGCLDDGRQVALLETHVARTIKNGCFHSLSSFSFDGYPTLPDIEIGGRGRSKA